MIRPEEADLFRAIVADEPWMREIGRDLKKHFDFRFTWARSSDGREVGEYGEPGIVPTVYAPLPEGA